MIEVQYNQILEGWDVYQADTQKKIIRDYLSLCSGYYSPEGFLTYLKDRLELDGYWRWTRLG
ncbi:MAG: hypothetical protein ACWGOX_00820 [Desulforhopalus sp.]